MNSETETIRDTNDRFRRGDPTVPGRIMITQGIQAVIAENEADVAALLQIVQDFNTFTEDNDPYELHDFGVFDFEGNRCFWKIDLFDTAYEFGSEAPTDLIRTARVLTVLLASEY